MARLQKTLDTSAASNIASVGQPVATRDLTGDVLQGVANAVKVGEQIVGAVKKTGLEEELGRFGEEISAINDGLDLKDATDRFKRLKKAKEQGILDDSRINIEAEAILKQKIGANSAFAPELRQAAADILGFDPTGSTLQKLFGKSGKTSPRRTLSPEEKMENAAAFRAEKLGLDKDVVLRTMLQAQQGAEELKIAQQRLATGDIGADEVLSTSLRNNDPIQADMIMRFRESVDDGGLNPSDAAHRQLAFTEAKQQEWANLVKTVSTGPNRASTAKLNEMKRAFDEDWAGTEALMTDGATLESLATSEANALGNLVKVAAIRTMPGLVVAQEAGGQAQVAEFIRINNKFGPNSPEMEQLMKIDPGLKFVKDSQAASASIVRSAVNKVLGQEPISGDPAATQPLLDHVARDAVKNTKDPSVRNRVLTYLENDGKPVKMLSMMAQPGVREIVTPAEVNSTKQRFATQFEPLKGNIAAMLADGKNTLSIVSGKIVVKPTNINPDPSAGGVLGVSLDISSPANISTSVAQMNTFVDLVKNGWGADVGESPGGFAERIVNGITTLNATEGTPNEPDAIGVAFDQAIKNPTAENMEALRLLDPDLFNAAASISIRGGSDGK